MDQPHFTDEAKGVEAMAAQSGEAPGEAPAAVDTVDASSAMVPPTEARVVADPAEIPAAVAANPVERSRGGLRKALRNASITFGVHVDRLMGRSIEALPQPLQKPAAIAGPLVVGMALSKGLGMAHGDLHMPTTTEAGQLASMLPGLHGGGSGGGHNEFAPTLVSHHSGGQSGASEASHSVLPSGNHGSGTVLNLLDRPDGAGHARTTHTDTEQIHTLRTTTHPDGGGSSTTDTTTPDQTHDTIDPRADADHHRTPTTEHSSTTTTTTPDHDTPDPRDDADHHSTTTTTTPDHDTPDPREDVDIDHHRAGNNDQHTTDTDAPEHDTDQDQTHNGETTPDQAELTPEQQEVKDALVDKGLTPQEAESIVRDQDLIDQIAELDHPHGPDMETAPLGNYSRTPDELTGYHQGTVYNSAGHTAVDYAHANGVEDFDLNELRKNPEFARYYHNEFIDGVLKDNTGMAWDDAKDLGPDATVRVSGERLQDLMDEVARIRGDQAPAAAQEVATTAQEAATTTSTGTGSSNANLELHSLRSGIHPDDAGSSHTHTTTSTTTPDHTIDPRDDADHHSTTTTTTPDHDTPDPREDVDIDHHRAGNNDQHTTDTTEHEPDDAIDGRPPADADQQTDDQTLVDALVAGGMSREDAETMVSSPQGRENLQRFFEAMQERERLVVPSGSGMGVTDTIHQVEPDGLNAADLMHIHDVLLEQHPDGKGIYEGINTYLHDAGNGKQEIRLYGGEGNFTEGALQTIHEEAAAARAHHAQQLEAMRAMSDDDELPLAA